MKKKASPKKKTAPKKTKKVAAPVQNPITFRFLNATQQPGARHMVRVVTDCSTSHQMFNTIEEVNNFLYQFDQEYHGKNPEDTGTWIDLIVTNIHGDVFDLDELEEVNEEVSD